MFNEVAQEAWLTLNSCYLIGWNQKIPAGITASGAAGLHCKTTATGASASRGVLAYD